MALQADISLSVIKDQRTCIVYCNGTDMQCIRYTCYQVCIQSFHCFSFLRKALIRLTIIHVRNGEKQGGSDDSTF